MTTKRGERTRTRRTRATIPRSSTFPAHWKERTTHRKFTFNLESAAPINTITCYKTSDKNISLISPNYGAIETGPNASHAELPCDSEFTQMILLSPIARRTWSFTVTTAGDLPKGTRKVFGSLISKWHILSQYPTELTSSKTITKLWQCRLNTIPDLIRLTLMLKMMLNYPID